jgi:P27 family predicted phage terminase small subunit
MMDTEEDKIDEHDGEQGASVGPTPLNRVPVAPKELSDAGADHWREITQALKKLGRLFKEDMPALVVLCHVYQDIEDSRQKMHNAIGNDMYLRFKKCFDDSFKLYTGQLKEFGLTPASRAKLKGEKLPEPKDGFNSF